MGKIQVLEQNLINQIAAGEVIERPVSVVKELVENSLDAGASQITIEIANGGKDLIKVIDNGEGITKEDLPLALERHATSKISTPEDLFKISTLGFRGEALASIASVSQLDILSKHQGSTEAKGYRLILENSKVLDIETAAANVGTSITVKELFKNLPGRLKFLKSAQTEASHINEFISRLMLSRPDVSYTFISDGKTVLKNSGSTGDPDLALRNAIATVFGTASAKALKKVNLDFSDFKISGFVTEPIIQNSSRQYLFFVNNRHIFAPVLNKAVDTAVSDIMPSGKYPTAVLFIQIAYDQVDVNVHPAKKEVRFAESSKVFDAVRSAVRNAYAQTPRFMEKTLENIPTRTVPEFSANPAKFDFGAVNYSANKLEYSAQPNYTPSYVAAMPESEMVNGLIVLGQANRLFVIVLDGEDLLLVDQHAGHERVLYEQVKEAYGKNMHLQSLLMPEMIDLGSKLKTVLSEHTDIIKALGFEWDEYEGNSVLLRAVPLWKTKTSPVSLFKEIVSEIEQSGGTNSAEAIQENIFATIACKAAIKDGDILDLNEMRKLVNDLWATPNYQTCPHGRPTIIALTKEELFKKFKRT